MKTSNSSEGYEKLLTAQLGRVMDMLRFAEAKNAALLTFASAWIAGIVNLISSGKAFPPGYHAACLFALPLFIVAAIIAVSSLLPKLSTSTFTGAPKGQSKNLLFFGDIAELAVDQFQLGFRDAYRRADGSVSQVYLADLEVQVSINSKIAVRKHRLFNIGAIVATIAISAFVVPTLLKISSAICEFNR